MRALLFLLTLCCLAPATFAQSRKCTCLEGNGSYLWLHCPKAPPADPDPCPATYAGNHPSKGRPKGWSAACWSRGTMACFLRRHAASWNIQCTLCVKKACCKAPIEIEGLDVESAKRLVQVCAKQKNIGGRLIEMAVSPHYALVSNLKGLKMQTAGGGPRILGQHEFLHLYLQRAEMARRDFVNVFGHPRETRSMIFLIRSDSVRRAYSQVHWGNPDTNLLYGGGSAGKLDGYASNGFILSGRSDDDLHFNCRHMIGHLCISTYHSGSPFSKHLPQWIFRGAAHWLCKLHPRAEDHAYFCSFEGVTVSGSGTKWDAKARKVAARGPQRDPVERMLQAGTAKQMNFQMHVRAWSWFDVFAAEERGPFVKFVQRLREAQEARLACKAAFGQPPEIVDQRWRERVMGKRRKVTATNKEKERETDVEAATNRELTGIANEIDLQLLASKIRGLDRCQNVRTARLIVSLVDARRSERVRTVIELVLKRTKDEKVLEYLRGRGYERAGKLGRATLCTVFGAIKHEKATELMRTALGDSYWLVKSNAARALAQLGDKQSISTVGEMAAKSPNAKVRIACMDALGIYGADAAKTIPLFERNLMNRRWQVKVATCDTFRKIGHTSAVDMLIGRLDSEGGRVHDEIRTALKELTGVDKDWRGEIWRKWWVKAKRFAEAEKKMRKELDKEKTKPKETKPNRYATQKKPPTYYGIKVYARAVAYVLDTSSSMKQGFRVSQVWQDRLGHKLTATSRIGVCKQELTYAIRELDPRTRINLIFFSNRVRQWKKFPVPAGSNAESAISAVKNLTADGQTNYYGALRLVLGMEEEGSGWSPTFADTPDTFFFLTDGTPTDGEITKSDELLAWFKERNRFARCRVHVIAMGNTGVDVDFLRKLAENNAGKFLHMTGSH